MCYTVGREAMDFQLFTWTFSFLLFNSGYSVIRAKRKGKYILHSEVGSGSTVVVWESGTVQDITKRRHYAELGNVQMKLIARLPMFLSYWKYIEFYLKL